MRSTSCKGQPRTGPGWPGSALTVFDETDPAATERVGRNCWLSRQIDGFCPQAAGAASRASSDCRSARSA
jgi:hypothetical protein